MKKLVKRISVALSIMMLLQCLQIPGLIRFAQQKVHGAGNPLDVKINFQPYGVDIPDGYLPDYGEVYGEKNGYTYG